MTTMISTTCLDKGYFEETIAPLTTIVSNRITADAGTHRVNTSVDIVGENRTGRNHYRNISFLPRTNCRDLVTRRTCLAVIAHKAALSASKTLVSPCLSYLSPTPLNEVSTINLLFSTFFFVFFPPSSSFNFFLKTLLDIARCRCETCLGG